MFRPLIVSLAVDDREVSVLVFQNVFLILCMTEYHVLVNRMATWSQPISSADINPRAAFCQGMQLILGAIQSNYPQRIGHKEEL